MQQIDPMSKVYTVVCSNCCVSIMRLSDSYIKALSMHESVAFLLDVDALDAIPDDSQYITSFNNLCETILRN